MGRSKKIGPSAVRKGPFFVAFRETGLIAHMKNLAALFLLLSTTVRDALATTRDFPGVTGKITINANRNAQVPVYMLRIDKNGKFSLE